MELKEAISCGAKRYFSGKPCRLGHICERLVSTRSCIECENIRRRKWRENNLEKSRFMTNRWAKNNPVKRAIASRRRRTGFTLELFNAVLDKQGNACAICRKKFGKTREDRPNADHCHATKMPRGILCSRCNTILGQLKDDQETVKRMLDYLKFPPAKLISET